MGLHQNEYQAVIAGVVAHQIAAYRQTQSDYVSRFRTGRQESEARLWARWGKAFDQFDLCVNVVWEAGDTCNNRHRPAALARNDLVFEVLTRLHSRACRTASEIRTLLVTGHGDGALARSRTLYELAVIGDFVRKYGEEVAERYLYHETIDRYKQAIANNIAAANIGSPMVEPEYMEELAAERDQLCKRLGRPFKYDYGWAAEVLAPGNDKYRPDFHAIEKRVFGEGAHQYYQRASMHIHGGAAGSSAHIKFTASGNVYITGPSNGDLAFPAGQTLAALLECTAGYLGLSFEHYSDAEAGITNLTLISLVQEAVATFYAIEKELEAERQANETVSRQAGRER